MPRRQILATLTLPAALLAGCTQVVPVPVAVPVPAENPADACNSAAYQQYVGQKSPAISLPPGVVMRHYRTGDPVTADLNEARLNFEYDRSGKLVRVSCG